MIDSHLAYDEQQALKAICRSHDVPDDPKLIGDLATFCNWIKQVEQDKVSFGPPKAPFLISQLSLMGLLTPKGEQ